MSVFFIRKISGPLEWASTPTRKLKPLIGPAKSICIWDLGCSGYVQCESTIRGGFFCASIQGIQLLTVFSMSESTLGQYITLRSMAFIQLIPGCPECNCLRTAFLSFVGTTTRSTSIRHSLMMDKESQHCLNGSRSPVRLGGHECLKNLWTFYIIVLCWVSCLISTLVTGIVQIQSVSACWKLSSMLIALMMVSSSGTDCKLMKHDKASTRPNSVVLRHCMLKSYSNKMIAQHCCWLAEYTGIPFFKANIGSNDLHLSEVCSVAWITSCEMSSQQKPVQVLPFLFGCSCY